MQKPRVYISKESTFFFNRTKKNPVHTARRTYDHLMVDHAPTREELVTRLEQAGYEIR